MTLYLRSQRMSRPPGAHVGNTVPAGVPRLALSGRKSGRGFTDGNGRRAGVGVGCFRFSCLAPVGTHEDFFAKSVAQKSLRMCSDLCETAWVFGGGEGRGEDGSVGRGAVYGW